MWPLTGVVIAAPDTGKIPVLVAKVDNSPWARPHAGINDADQVYEIQVEGITRFMELFHSKSPDRIGPIRSARSSDIDLMGNLHRPLLAWSGGNPGVTQQVKDAEAAGILVDVSHQTAEADYYRDARGQAGVALEHTLFTSVVKLRADYTPADAEPPGSMFDFHAPGTPAPATALDIPGIVIDFGLGVRIEYVWDAERGCWDRFQVDQNHPRNHSAFVDEANVQVCPPNVVILFLTYGQSEVDSRSPKALSVGDGDGLVLIGGKATAVHWRRATPGDGWNLTDASTGEPVSLEQGRTWVALPQKGSDSALPLDPATAAGLLALRV